MLHKGQKTARIIREAPLACIEILSPEDNRRRMEQRLSDYLAMGVKHVWVFDPESRDVFRIVPEGRHRVEDGILAIAGTPIRLVLQDIFAALDEDAEEFHAD